MFIGLVRFVFAPFRRSDVPVFLNRWNQSLFFCTEASTKGLFEKLRKNDAEVTLQEMLDGLTALSTSTKSLPTIYADLPFLGERLILEAADMKSTQIVEVIHSYSALKYVSAKWIQKLTQNVKPEELEQRANIKFLAALGYLQRLHDKAKAPRHSVFMTGPLPTFDRIQHVPLIPDQIHVIRKTLEQLTQAKLEAAEVTKVIYAVSQLIPTQQMGIDFVKQLLNQSFPVTDQSSTTLESFLAQILLYSLARLGINDTVFTQFLLKCITERSRRRRTINFDQISMILYSMGQLEIHDRETILRLLEDAATKEALSRFSAWDLSTLLYSLSQLEFKGMDREIEKLVTEVIRSRRLSTFSEQGIGLVIYALGHIQLKHVRVFQMLLEEVMKPVRVEELTYKGLCMIVHGLSKLSDSQTASIRDQYLFMLEILTGTIKIQLESNEAGYTGSQIVSLFFGCGLCHSAFTEKNKAFVLARIMRISGDLGSAFLSSLSPKELMIVIRSLLKLLPAHSDIWQSVFGHLESMEWRQGRDPGLAAEIVHCFMQPTAPPLRSDAHAFLLHLYSSSVKSDRLREASPVELIGLLYATPRLAFTERKDAMTSLLTEICRSERLRSLSQHGLARILTFLVQPVHVHHSSSSTIRILLSRVQMDRMDDQSLVALLYRFAKHRSEDRWSKQMLQQVTARQGLLSSLSGSYISMLAESLSNFPDPNREASIAVMQRVVARGVIETISEKGLVLLLHAMTKLQIRSALFTRIVLDELRRRSSVDHLPDDLLSMLLYTLTKSQQPDAALFDRIFQRLESINVEKMDAQAAVNILDSVSRQGDARSQLIQSLVRGIHAHLPYLRVRELHHFFHALGRLRIEEPFVRMTLRSFIQSRRMDVLDASALTGLVVAAAESGIRDPETTQTLLTRALAPEMFDSFLEVRLCSLVYRLHVFNYPEELQERLMEFVHRVSRRLREGKIAVRRFTQLAAGFGKLAEKYPNAILTEALLVMGEESLLTRMRQAEIVTLLVVISRTPTTTVDLAQRLVAFFLKRRYIDTIGASRLNLLREVTAVFGDNLPDLKDSLEERIQQ